MAAIRTIDAFAPGALVVALGLDASEQDPLKGLSITTNGFNRIGAAIARIGLPTVIVQEGGYLSDVLGDNLTAFLGGFEGTR
jgi:acetoin utilization deacetylase AcuC-like enzyme